jgi:Zn-dependent M28 family amino/carboxypeptidase
MKKYLIYIFVSVACFSFGQNNNDSLQYNQLKTFVYTLANDSMKGRASGSIEEQKALNYISTTFKDLAGKKLKIQNFSFSKDSVEYNCKNAYYFINNHSKKTILLSAHYDHIGLGGSLSMSLENDKIHNGADDNASGVALLLSLSKELVELKDTKVNYLIVFYSGHELGLFGSSAFYKKMSETKKFKELSLVINFDMIGRMDPIVKKLKCMSSPKLNSFLTTFPTERFSFKLNVYDEEKLKLLDTKMYVEAGIPCINFTTGIHNDYHKTSDDPQYLNYDGMVQIHNFMLELLKKFLFSSVCATKSL